MMNNKQKHRGFSLTEVLIAVGILSVGMVFVAGVFPAGIYLMTVATERTIASVATDEAFAKIKIYGINFSKLSQTLLKDFNDVLPTTINIDPCEFTYPSTNTADEKQYHWSALCRLTEAYDPVANPNPPVEVTVFVCRKANPNLKYPAPPDGSSGTVNWPMPIKVNVSGTAGSNELTITGTGNEKTYINDGYTIVDDATGKIYRVLERYKAPNDRTILLDRNWEGTAGPGDVWVVPPPVNGGRCPCIVVYQNSGLKF